MKTSAAEWNDRLNPIVTRVLVDPREKPAPFYSNIGRPSIDPELMIRMLIVGYCYCIRFERKLWTRSSANWILSLLWPPRPGGYPRDGLLSLLYCPGYVRHQLFQTVLGRLKLRRLCVHFHLPLAALLRGSRKGSSGRR